MTSDQVVQRYEITTRVGHREIPPGEGATARAIEAAGDSARSSRLAGLADDLNPTVLDQEKIKGFFSGLPKVPPAALENLRRRTLNLNDPKLQLHAYSPVTPAALEQGYTLMVEDGPPGQIARVRLRAPIDVKMARERANRAKQSMRDADREASELDPKKKQPGADSAVFVAHSNAQRKRFATATVWRDLVSALADHDPADAVLRAEAAQARESASRYTVAPWTGMP